MKSKQRDSSEEHFSDARWADFARNVGGEEDRGEVLAHLDAGCEPCREIANRLGVVAMMAKNERKLLVPPELMERAKGIAEAPAPSSGWIENLNAIVAHLITSVPQDWQPAGVRSLGESPRPAGSRMVYRADDYAIHLKVEALLGGETAEIIGEIANEREDGESMEGIPVQMVARGQTLSESATNRFGEFLIEYPIRKNATLRFALAARGQRIDVPLDSGGSPGDRG